MAKLTLSFRDHLIAVHELDGEPITIGRDPDCRVHIDSLAIAPRHAEVLMTPSGYLLLALDEAFPVLINEETVEEGVLRHGDCIQVGKHSIRFTDDDPASTAWSGPSWQKIADPAQPANEASMPAYIQVQSGPMIGRVIVLRRSVTRLNRVGVDDLVITRDRDRYVLVRLGEETWVSIDGRPMMGDEAPLTDKTGIEAGAVLLRFFTGASGQPETRAANAESPGHED
jgi:pSer/pThr/pTyr-binding forkhead associated (FHA) protein